MSSAFAAMESEAPASAETEPVVGQRHASPTSAAGSAPRAVRSPASAEIGCGSRSMLAVADALLWPVRAIGALLPDGWAGLARQLAVFVPFDIAYEALARARDRAGRRRRSSTRTTSCTPSASLGIYHEHAVQHWAMNAPGFVMDVANFTYFQCQFTITFGFVIWVYMRRNDAYTLLRNTLFATFMLAVAGYILYPTAPPRLLAPSTASSTRSQSAALNQQGTLVTLFGNPYAAMPSLHTATAHPRRRDRRARHAGTLLVRADLGALPRRSSCSRSSPPPTTSSSTPIAGAGVLARRARRSC